MTTAVLKNRLLNLTERAFKEEDYGALNFTAFVRQYPDLIALDESSAPPKVILVGDVSSTVVSEATVAGRRIRPDLWAAVVDYQSGDSYYWNGSEVVTGDAIENDAENLPQIPTISRDEMRGWRGDFATNFIARLQDDEEVMQIRRWHSDFLPTMELPAAARAAWNDELKHHVITRLAGWFRDHGLPLPIDLVQQRPQPRRVVSSETAQLRELILRCVRAMTEEELRSLKLPPAAVLRAVGH
ncbi:hypothetical protein ABT278_20920 [Streptomyces sp. NPDC001228]|uniref:hypothetical protein n=1 Tax=Streptomyces sp. NPDC001228 TaxID=3154381 RepID=UPI00332C3D9B